MEGGEVRKGRRSRCVVLGTPAPAGALDGSRDDQRAFCGEPLRARAVAGKGHEDATSERAHAARPKKSLGMTAPFVASAILPISSRFGMVFPSAARVIVETETLVASASLVADCPGSAR